MPGRHFNEPVQSVGVSGVTDTIQAAGLVFPSLSRAVATYNSNEIFAPDSKGVRVFIDITVHNGGTLVVSLQVRDPVTDKWVTVTGATTAGLTGANGTYTLTVYPGITVAAGGATAGAEINNFVDVSYRVVAVVSVAAVTFSIGAVNLL